MKWGNTSLKQKNRRKIAIIIAHMGLWHFNMRVPIEWMILTLYSSNLIKWEVFLIFNMYYYSFNDLYSVESDSLTSWKAANCFDFVFRFIGNGIWKPPVSIWSTSYLTRAVKYDEHSWIGYVRVLYGRLLDICKKLSNISSGMPCMSIPFLSFHPFLIS